MTPRPLPARSFDAATLGWLLLLALALLIYALGLGGQYNPSNGDELVYTHIARLTAASGHWLPLVSDLDHMRNTKPPLLFWQALLATDWGRHWSMGALRTPSLIYTLLTAGAVAWTVQKISGDLRQACLAACIYLAFFSTFRYGRAYLTSAPETFWLSVPLFWLLWRRWRDARASMGWITHIGFGLALGLGLAYKSFALIAPAAAALWCAQLWTQADRSWRSTLRTTLQVSLSTALALGFFALWFALDPDPGAVWQEFVIGENADKLSDSQGYWHAALMGGGSSIWVQLLAYVQNAGLLAFAVIGLVWAGVTPWLNRRSQGQGPGDANKLRPAHLPILLIWLAVWLVVFTVPSQRSARYLIPAMPALAVLLALYWQRIARPWFLLSLLLCCVFAAALGRVAWAAHELGIGNDAELAATMLTVLVIFVLLTGGFLRPAWTRACALGACLLVYACLSLATAPINGAAGHYPAAAAAALHQARVAVPSSFNGQFERFEFLLPGNRFVPYDGERRGNANPTVQAAELKRLLAQHDAVVWLQSSSAETQPPCRPHCTLLGMRWEIQGRQQRGEINRTNFWTPQTWLFRREWLLTSATAPVVDRATR